MMRIDKRLSDLERKAGDDQVIVEVIWDSDKLEPGPGVRVVHWPDDHPDDNRGDADGYD